MLLLTLPSLASAITTILTGSCPSRASARCSLRSMSGRPLGGMRQRILVTKYAGPRRRNCAVEQPSTRAPSSAIAERPRRRFSSLAPNCANAPIKVVEIEVLRFAA